MAPQTHRPKAGVGILTIPRTAVLVCKELLLEGAQALAKSWIHTLQRPDRFIGWRLKLRKQEQSEWNEDNPFYWRFALQGRDVPPDTEEHAAGFYERGEYEKAEAIFRLLIDCFGGYAEGYNYLGLIAYQQRKLDEAIGHFEKTIELGRKLFPTHIGKKHYWSDLATRPYMRGLMNLALTLNETGRYEEALAACHRLERECGDVFSAASHRSAVYLNTHKWELAADAARRSGGDLDPSAAFVEALALFELGRPEAAFPAFLHAAMRYPRAARMLVDARTSLPKSSDEARDHNVGVSLHRQLHAYLKNQPRAAKTFFRALVRDSRTAKLLDESIAVVRRWHKEHRNGDRSAFDRMTAMRSRQFADAKARELRDLLPRGHERRLALH